MAGGDVRREAYTAIMRGGILSRERPKSVEAEAVTVVEGKMCGAVMRGTDALPWSETPSRTKGSRRKLGDLMFGRAANDAPVRSGKARSYKPEMNGHEKSDGCVVAVKPRTRSVMSRWRRVWSQGGRSKGRDKAEHAPGPVPDFVCP